MNKIIVLILIAPLYIISIAALDYLMFKRWAICEYGHPPHKSAWLLACLLETFFFISGFIIGQNL
jgi:hypothetical protein